MTHVIKGLKHNCVFCDTPTNFKENGHAYCLNCYARLQKIQAPILPTVIPQTPPHPYMPWEGPRITWWS